jgi:hypothetical protein
MNEDAQRFLSRLDRCGWFRDVPAKVAEGIRQRVGQRSLTVDLQAALVAVVVDSQYLLSDRPYTALLEQFASASGGLFKPELIRERASGDRMEFAFEHAGREYRLDLPAEADEPPHLFFKTINRALAEAGSVIGFYEIRDLPWGPIAGFAITSAQAFTAALAMRLFDGVLPQETTDQDLAELQLHLFGEADYTWRLRDVVVGSMTVPGDFDEIGPEDSTDDPSTTLFYEKTGLILLRWGSALEPRSLIGSAFVISSVKKVTETERREGTARTIRQGTVSVDDCPMAWRLDQFSKAPVQVLVCVPVQLFERFAAAPESFRFLPEATVLQEALTPAKSVRKKR